MTEIKLFQVYTASQADHACEAIALKRQCAQGGQPAGEHLIRRIDTPCTLLSADSAQIALRQKVTTSTADMLRLMGI